MSRSVDTDVRASTVDQEDLAFAKSHFKAGSVQAAVAIVGPDVVAGWLDEAAFDGTVRVSVANGSGDTGTIVSFEAHRSGEPSKGWFVVGADGPHPRTLRVRVDNIDRVLSWHGDDRGSGAGIAEHPKVLESSVPAPFLLALERLVRFTDRDLAPEGPVFRVRLDGDTKEGNTKTGTGHTWRILVRPVEEPMLHNEIEQVLKIAEECELWTQHSSAGLELRFPGDV